MCEHTFVETDKAGYVVCSRCGTFHSPQHGAPAELYQNHYWSHGRGHSTIQEQVYNVTQSFQDAGSKNDAVMRLLPARGQAALEVACAPGELLKRLAERFDKVYGVEVDAQYEAELREVSGGQAELLFGLFPTVTRHLPPASLDCVVALDVFEHVPDGAAFIQECARLLRPDGTLVLMSPFVYPDGVFDDRMFHPVEHVWLYSTAWLQGAFAEHFTDLRFERWCPGHEILVATRQGAVTAPVDERFDRIACPFCASLDAVPFRSAADIVQCRGCQTVYLRTRMKTEAMEKLYQSYADDGSHLALPATVADATASPWKRDYFLQEILTVNSTRGPLLDVGCGWGAFLLGAKENGFAPYGIEITRKAVRYANEQLQIPVVNTQFLDTALVPNSVQVLTMNHVLEHLPQPRQALTKAFEILRPDGLFCGIVPNIDSFCSRRQGDQWYWLDPNYHYVHYSPATLRAHLEAAGFQVERIYTARGDYDPALIRQVAGREDEAFIQELETKGQGEELRFFARKPAGASAPVLPAEPFPHGVTFDWPAALDPFVTKQEGRYLFLSDAIFDRLDVLAELEPFYFQCGGAGDALLLMATFYDTQPRSVVLSHPNSIPAARSFFDAFPELTKVYFLPPHSQHTQQAHVRARVATLANCRGRGVTPAQAYEQAWTEQTDIFRDYGVQPRPAWARRFQQPTATRRVTVAPRGSLVGMAGSKRNLIEPRDWVPLLDFLRAAGFTPVIIGTPDEQAEYPSREGCEDRRSYSFAHQMTEIASSDLFVGADSWAKTFAALAGVRTIVFEAIKSLDWVGQKDPSDYIFLDPWDNIQVVSGWAHWQDLMRRDQPRLAPATTPPTKPVHVAWEGTFQDHGSLSHVNRELTKQLARQPQLAVVRVGAGQRAQAPTRTQVTVRHMWPPDWRKPKHGAWVLIQPWEFGSLPAEWPRQIAAVDEVWVPSEYARRVYVDSGVPPAKVRVVPNGIDPDTFQPGVTPLPLPTKKQFKFLFVGGTIPRKGPDVLLASYLQAFRAPDDVCLVIKDFTGQVYAGQTLEEQIRAAQRDPDAPEILYLNEDWPAAKLPALYAACDCLVHPYRGEGFGLPVLEAMACGLPVVVTAGGACDDFATEEWAYRIPATRQTIGYAAGPFALTRPGWWLEPAAAELTERLRWLVTHRDEARAKGRAASDFVRREWTWARAATIAASRLGELAERPVTRRAPPAPVRVVAAGVLPPLPDKPRLTVGVIAKNEEQFIGRCLESVRGLADQIVVVDTGSTDRTVDRARARGAEVYHREWTDDFSAARNEVLAHATGDWVLMLDADEELPLAARATLQQELREQTTWGFRLPIVDAGREGEGCHYVPRLFRRTPAVRYAGRIHEQVTGIALADWRLGKTTIRHHGYTAELNRDRNKIYRNLRLLELALQEQPDDPNLLMNLGLELARSGRLAAGIEQSARAWQVMSAMPAGRVSPELRETLLTQLGTHLSANQQFRDVVRLYQSRLAQQSELTAGMNFTLGLAQMHLHAFADAAAAFRQCLATRDRPTLCPGHQDVRTGAPRHCLAMCLMRLRKMTEAGQEFAAALAEDPQSRPLRLEYAGFLVAQGQPVEALQMLHALVAEQADFLGAWLAGGQIALSRPEFVEFAGDWTQAAARLFPREVPVQQQRAEALLLAGRLAEALPIWQEAGVGPRELAAIAICEWATDRDASVALTPEPVVSREFIHWCRRLMAWGQPAVVERLAARLDVWRGQLPTAADLLAAALAEAAEPVVK